MHWNILNDRHFTVRRRHTTNRTIFLHGVTNFHEWFCSWLVRKLELMNTWAHWRKGRATFQRYMVIPSDLIAHYNKLSLENRHTMYTSYFMIAFSTNSYLSLFFFKVRIQKKWQSTSLKWQINTSNKQIEANWECRMASRRNDFLQMNIHSK